MGKPKPNKKQEAQRLAAKIGVAYDKINLGLNAYLKMLKEEFAKVDKMKKKEGNG